MLAAQDYAWAIDVEICAFQQEGLTGKAETDAFLVEALDLVPGPSVRPQATTATARHRSTAFSNLRGRTTSISTCTWISALPPMTWTFTMSENCPRGSATEDVSRSAMSPRCRWRHPNNWRKSRGVLRIPVLQ